MGELSRNRPLQPRKLTHENVVRLKMSLARVKPCLSVSHCFFAVLPRPRKNKPSLEAFPVFLFSL